MTVGLGGARAGGARGAATSPVGGHVLVFDAATRNVVGNRPIEEVCGIAPDGADFFVSDARGRLWQGERLVSQTPDVAWDNHVRRVG